MSSCVYMFVICSRIRQSLIHRYDSEQPARNRMKYQQIIHYIDASCVCRLTNLLFFEVRTIVECFIIRKVQPNQAAAALAPSAQSGSTLPLLLHSSGPMCREVPQDGSTTRCFAALQDTVHNFFRCDSKEACHNLV